MWASIVKAFNGLLSLIDSIMEQRREAQLREDGAAREALKQYQEAANARSLADEIDRRPEFTDKRELLDRLRKQRETTPNHLGQTNILPRGNSGVAQWSAG